MMSLMCCYIGSPQVGKCRDCRMTNVRHPTDTIWVKCFHVSMLDWRLTSSLAEKEKFLANSPLAKFLDAPRRGTRSNIWWKQYVDTERAQEMNLSLWISMDPTYGKWFHGEEAVMSKSWMPFLKNGVICCLVHDDIMPSEFINRAELGFEEFHRCWNPTDGCKGLRKRAGWVRWKGYYVIWAEF